MSPFAVLLEGFGWEDLVAEDVVGGRAVIWGMYWPLETRESTLVRPKTSLNSSSAEGLALPNRGRSSFASSVARAKNMERGRLMPRVS